MANLPQDPVKKNDAPYKGQDNKMPPTGDQPSDKPMDKPSTETSKQ